QAFGYGKICGRKKRSYLVHGSFYFKKRPLPFSIDSMLISGKQRSRGGLTNYSAACQRSGVAGVMVQVLPNAFRMDLHIIVKKNQKLGPGHTGASISSPGPPLVFLNQHSQFFLPSLPLLEQLD